MTKKNLKKYFIPKNYYDFILRLFKKLIANIFGIESMENSGERVHLLFGYNIFLDRNEECHLARYRFAADLIKEGSVVGDFACGTGYGSLILAQKAKIVIGTDIANHVIKRNIIKYKDYKNVDFICDNLLNLKYKNTFDYIISFETLEHLEEENIPKVLVQFEEALKPNGILVFSTPYMQEKSERAIQMGFHKTFYIDENKIKLWLGLVGLVVNDFKYQNLKHVNFSDVLYRDDVNNNFIITIVTKKQI